MAGTVIVSVRMVNVSSCEIVWQNDLIKNFDSYDYIGSYSVLDSSGNTGLGAMGGLTFRFAKIGLDIDLNFTYRKRPSRIIEDIMYEDYIILFAATLSDNYITRKVLSNFNIYLINSSKT